jgi:hypothetical protein
VLTAGRVLELELKSREDKEVCGRAIRMLFRKSIAKKA